MPCIGTWTLWLCSPHSEISDNPHQCQTRAIPCIPLTDYLVLFDLDAVVDWAAPASAALSVGSPPTFMGDNVATGLDYERYMWPPADRTDVRRPYLTVCVCACVCVCVCVCVRVCVCVCVNKRNESPPRRRRSYLPIPTNLPCVCVCVCATLLWGCGDVVS